MHAISVASSCMHVDVVSDSLCFSDNNNTKLYSLKTIPGNDTSQATESVSNGTSINLVCVSFTVEKLILGS